MKYPQLQDHTTEDGRLLHGKLRTIWQH